MARAAEPAAAPPPVALVVAVNGPVSLSTDAGPHPLTAFAALRAGDALTVGEAGELELQYLLGRLEAWSGPATLVVGPDASSSPTVPSRVGALDQSLVQALRALPVMLAPGRGSVAASTVLRGGEDALPPPLSEAERALTGAVDAQAASGAALARLAQGVWRAELGDYAGAAEALSLATAACDGSCDAIVGASSWVGSAAAAVSSRAAPTE